MITAFFRKHVLKFKQPSGTSRGVLRDKETFYIIVNDGNNRGVGECGLLRGLSLDDRDDYEEKLQWTCDNIHLGAITLWEKLKEFPSIQFGVEMAFKSLTSLQPFDLFPSAFTSGNDTLDINGLIWMGDPEFMRSQIDEKLELGFDCIKMKIGAIEFEKEIALLKFIRKNYDKNTITLRVDANGGFAFAKAKKVLHQLAELDIHSIEQPISVNQWENMATLCANTPVPIALDEELIGVIDVTKKRELLQTVRPQYVILKPSFIGGFKGSQEWIDLANSLDIGWWITSALESNVGLNAIAQWSYKIGVHGPQGLGTGSLYTNNIVSPLEVKNGKIGINPQLHWDFKYN